MRFRVNKRFCTQHQKMHDGPQVTKFYDLRLSEDDMARIRIACDAHRPHGNREAWKLLRAMLLDAKPSTIDDQILNDFLSNL